MSASPAGASRDRALAGVVIAVALVAYAMAPGTAFQYDDFRVVVIDRDVHSWGAWWSSMPGMRPLTKASYVANWLVSPKPAGFAVAGVAMHVASSLLVLALARRWIGALAPSISHPAIAALATALVFALHPAQTEAIVYIAGRSTALSSLATLGALHAWERARDGRTPWRVGAWLLFAAAMGARESAWTLPFLLVLVEVARGAGLRDAIRRTTAFWLLFAALAVAVLAVPAYRQLLATSLAIRGPLDNLVAQVGAIAYLVTRPLVTLRVNFDPGLVARDAIDAAWLAQAATLVALGILGCASLRRRPWLGFGILWFLLALLPTHGPLARYELANDRQLYLAIVGPALIVGVGLASWTARATASIALALLSLVLAAATFVRVTDYASETRLWEATVRAAPGNARAWNNLGHAYELAGDRDRAREAYRRALVIDPAHPKAASNLDALHPAGDPAPREPARGPNAGKGADGAVQLGQPAGPR